MGNNIVVKNAVGKGNINIKKVSGKSTIRVELFPKIKNDIPIIKKNIEKPDKEKI